MPRSIVDASSPRGETMPSFFVVDTRSDQIVNCIETRTWRDAERCRRGMLEAEHLRIDENPSQAQLDAYPYWSERP